MMIATNANVAFHTIFVTSETSAKLTTPVNSARVAPPIADQPIPSPFGCQMTKHNVSKNIMIAIYNKLKSPNLICNKLSE
ncbi:hypothetical protein D3C77_687980 [compost metagenome]